MSGVRRVIGCGLHDRNLGGVVRAAGTGRGRGRGGAPAIDPETGQPIARGGGAGRGGGRGAASPAATAGSTITPTFPSLSKYRVENRRLWYNWGYVDELDQMDVDRVMADFKSKVDATTAPERGAL